MKDITFTEALLLAIAGNHDAFEALLHLYERLLKNECKVNGVFDEDCYQYVMMRIAIQISKFVI